MTRIGKIARLPRQLRDQLNRRLQDGEPGKKLVAWLNSLPDVQKVLQKGFAGRPINQPNLSAWKSGGYLDWLLEQEIIEELRQIPSHPEPRSAGSPQLSDTLSSVVALRFAVAFAKWKGNPNAKLRRNLRTLGQLCRSVTHLRRGDHAGWRLGLAQDRFKWNQKIAQKPPKNHQN